MPQGAAPSPPLPGPVAPLTRPRCTLETPAVPEAAWGMAGLGGSGGVTYLVDSILQLGEAVRHGRAGPGLGTAAAMHHSFYRRQFFFFFRL